MCCRNIPVTEAQKGYDMRKVLIIDDSPFIAKEIAGIIEPKGYEIVGHAKNGETGIEMAEQLDPDIITLDIIMPGIDGIETAKELINRNCRAKIVMLSSLCDYDTLQEIKEIGLEYLVAKPIEGDRLLEVLNKVSEE